MEPFFTLLFAILSITTAFSQTTEMTGRVVDAATGEGLAYASVSIYHRPEATYTNTDGSFSLKVPTNRISDTAYISSVGYPGTTVLLRNLNHAVIKLTKMVYPVDEVIVKAKRKRRKTIVINPINNEPLHYKSEWRLDTFFTIKSRNNKIVNNYALIYVPFDSIYKRYRFVKEISVLQFLKGIDPSRDSYDYAIMWRGKTDDWKIRIRILNAVANKTSLGLDDRFDHHPGIDILCDNVIASKAEAKYNYDLDMQSQMKLDVMSPFEKSEYLKRTWTSSLGDITINLEKYKIVFPNEGIYYGIEYLGPESSCFWVAMDRAKENYLYWGLVNGCWLSYQDNHFYKPAISLTMSE